MENNEKNDGLKGIFELLKEFDKRIGNNSLEDISKRLDRNSFIMRLDALNGLNQLFKTMIDETSNFAEKDEYSGEMMIPKKVLDDGMKFTFEYAVKTLCRMYQDKYGFTKKETQDIVDEYVMDGLVIDVNNILDENKNEGE